MSDTIGPDQQPGMAIVAVHAAGAVALYSPEMIRAAGTKFDTNEKSAATRRAYISDGKIFAAWCRTHGLVACPADPQTIADFLAAQALQGVRTSTLGRRVAAIHYAHRLAGISDPPTNSEIVKVRMRGIRKTIGARPVKKSAATSDKITDMIAACDTNTLQGLRDRALLTLGFAGAFRRSELVALELPDLAEEHDGFRVTIRKSKTDQDGLGQEVPILRGRKLRPVDAVKEWLAAANITTDSPPAHAEDDAPAANYVFRRMNRGNKVTSEPLSTSAVAKIVKRYAEAAGLDPASFSGHSLRRGFLTSAALSGASLQKMMKVSRHKNVDTVMGYIEEADVFQNHAGEAFL